MNEEALYAHGRYHELISYGYLEYMVIENLENDTVTHFFYNKDDISLNVEKVTRHKTLKVKEPRRKFP